MNKFAGRDIAEAVANFVSHACFEPGPEDNVMMDHEGYLYIIVSRAYEGFLTKGFTPCGKYRGVGHQYLPE